ncbi:protein CHLOROPLAST VESICULATION [Typha latifolia]|uniref:protein CHLOROPLAST VESICULATION n=1 Tax=Typha latifolia TaxID=4733 RepID=UPI003C2FF302
MVIKTSNTKIIRVSINKYFSIVQLTYSDFRPASGDPSWRRGCVSTVACVIIGSAIGLTDGEGGAVLAGDITAVKVAEGRVMRWSDKRKCPPWHVNSLENIVPENLPRPWTRRRSNSIAAHDQTAPDVGFLAKHNTSCFSL